MKFHVFLKKTLTKGLIKLSPGKSYIHVSLITDNNCVQNTDKSENSSVFFLVRKNFDITGLCLYLYQEKNLLICINIILQN